MTIYAIHFKDEGCYHLKIKDSYNCPDHLLVNGKVVIPNGDIILDTDIIVEGGKLDVKAAIQKTAISHYINRESKEELSVEGYNKILTSCKVNGSFKDLESEYLYKKTQQVYIPVHFTYYDYETAVVYIEEAELHHDKYCVCSGRVSKTTGKRRDEEHFLFKFNKWEFANDTVRRIMAEFGVIEVNNKSEGEGKEYFILHKNNYTWLQLCRDEFFITRESFFGRIDDKDRYIYGSYDDVLKIEKDIEVRLHRYISSRLDKVRAVEVKKSSIANLKEKLNTLSKNIENRKMNRIQINRHIQSITREIEQLTNEK